METEKQNTKNISNANQISKANDNEFALRLEEQLQPSWLYKHITSIWAYTLDNEVSGIVTTDKNILTGHFINDLQKYGIRLESISSDNNVISIHFVAENSNNG